MIWRGTRKMPSTRAGWSAYYEAEFNGHDRDTSAAMAMWYQLLDLSEEL